MATIFLLILLSSITLFFLKLINNRTKQNPNLNPNPNRTPPGEMGLPWIGETMQFHKALHKNRLFEDFIQPRIQKHGKTFKTRIMGSPTIIINGSGSNRFILSNEFKLVVSSWPSSAVQLMGKHSIMEKTGDIHRRLRTILNQNLGPSGVESLLPKICDVIKSHLDQNWSKKNTIHLYKSAKFLTFTIMCECLLGIKVDESMFENFEKVLEGVFAPPVNFPGTSFWRAKQARGEIERVLVEVVRKKRKDVECGEIIDENGNNCLLRKLVCGLIRKEISEVEVVDNIVLLIFAAHDTTSFAIAMTFRMLAHHPHSYSRLLQEHMDIKSNKNEDDDLKMEDVHGMKYTWQVVRESIRLSPPIFGSFRRAIHDIHFDGFIIPKGWKVLWTAYGTHYDEEYFHEPEKFDPSRFEETIPAYVFVAFGGGPRVCAGYQLAKLNILIFLHYVVTRYNWSLDQLDEPIIMDPLPIPSKGMPIKISPKYS